MQNTSTLPGEVSASVTALNKQAMINALRLFINQRSGIDYANYGERESFMGDYRPILKHGRHARTMLRFVELVDSITAQMLLEAASAYSGRLQFIQRGDKVAIDYTTGQYFPTEYRRAACAVLARAIWDCFGHTYATGPQIRKAARRQFGPAIASAWFS